MSTVAWAVLAGLLWWLAAVAAFAPVRRGPRRGLAWLRWSVGLPVILGSKLEATRSRRLAARRRGRPYRGLRPFLWALAICEGLSLTVAAIAGLLSGAA